MFFPQEMGCKIIFIAAGRGSEVSLCTPSPEVPGQAHSMEQEREPKSSAVVVWGPLESSSEGMDEIPAASGGLVAALPQEWGFAAHGAVGYPCTSLK